MKNTIYAVTAGVALAISANAGDYYPATTSPALISSAPVNDWGWTGFYAGAQIGVNFNPDNGGVLEFDSNLDGTYGDNVPFGSPDDANAFRENFDYNFEESLSYGIHIGYDYQLSDRWVVGAVAEYNFTNLSESQSGFSATPAFYHEERELDSFGSFRLRAGYLITPRTLLFVTGGLSYANVNYDFDSNNPNGTSRGDQNDEIGYVVGAGVETRVTQNWSLSAEYLYTNTGGSDFTTSFDNGPFAAAAGSTDARGSDDEFDFHTVQLKLTYRF